MRRLNQAEKIIQPSLHLERKKIALYVKSVTLVSNYWLTVNQEMRIKFANDKIIQTANLCKFMLPT